MAENDIIYATMSIDTKPANIIKTCKDAMSQLTKYLSQLEKGHETLKQGLSDLLNEEDVKGLPSYKLLKATYMPFIDGTSAIARATESPGGIEGDDMDYDILHAPPRLRNARKRANRQQRQKAISAYKTEKDDELLHHSEADASLPTDLDRKPKYIENNSNNDWQQPDFDTCLIPDKKGNLPEPKVAKPILLTPVLKDEDFQDDIAVSVTVRPSDHIYLIAIKDKLYLRYNEYLYDSETHLRVAEIDNQGIKFNNGDNIPCETGNVVLNNEPVMETDEEPLFLDIKSEEKTVYYKINEHIAQAAGQLSDKGELLLWA